MEDKIKVYVSSNIKTKIENDAKNFELLKKNGEPNINSLLTRLIINYSDDFQTQRNNIFTTIKNNIVQSNISTDNIDNKMITNICDYFFSFDESPAIYDKIISIKPTKESQNIILNIENNCLSDSTLSGYFRKMIISYLKLPREKREIIIFKKEYDALLSAIKNKHQVFLSVKTSTSTSGSFSYKSVTTNPYSLCSSKEEFHIYLLSQSADSKKPKSTRLSRIHAIHELKTETAFSNEDIDTFQKMELFGPQFHYFSNDTPAVIKLSSNGKKKFNDIYIHRPKPDKVDHDLYYFSCSQDQLFQYFIKFGKDAYIVSPDSLRNKLHSFYSEALYSYNLYEKN